MLASKNLYIAVAVAAIALLIAVYFGTRNSNALSSHLPPKQEFKDEGSAMAGAKTYATSHAILSSAVLHSSGTPSMEPYLVGKNNYLLVDTSLPFFAIEVGDYVAYRAAWDHGNLVGHVVAKRSATSFIMSGINNPGYETNAPVTIDNYVGRIIFVATWP